jgi:Protein of unknown function with PCYCGC motif
MSGKSSGAAGLIVGLIVAALLGLGGAVVYQMRASADPSASSNGLTLNPDLFEGEIHAAYLVAQQHPELLAQLDCYCGCEQHEGHKNLLDCYRTNHAATCATCTGEAVTAGQLYENGTPVEQIRAILHQRYAH